MAIHNVVLVGADGRLGPNILKGLLADGFKVTVFKRAGSKSPSNYPPEVSVVKIPDDFPVDHLKEALKGQDAVIVTTGGGEVQVQKNLADAAAHVGIQRFIPADFGSCDSSMRKTQDLVPLYKQKTEMRDYLTELAKKNEKFAWTAIVPGHFFDWSPEYLHMWPKKRCGDILDDGDTKFSISTLAQVARAVTAVLRKPDETINKTLYIQSFNISQNELAKAFETATDSKWEWTHLKSVDVENKFKAAAANGDGDAVHELVWLLGMLHANWESYDNFAMKLLGLKEENLDEHVKRVATEWTK